MFDFATLVTPGTLVVYFMFCIVAAMQGADRRCGWLFTLLISVFFTPLCGMFVVLTSKDNKTHAFEEELLQYLRKLQKEKQ